MTDSMHAKRSVWAGVVVAMAAMTTHLPAQAPPGNVFADALTTAQQRCVKIYGAAAGAEVGYATGVIVSPDGLILSAHGIYLAGAAIRVVTPDGVTHQATIVRRSQPLQSVLLKIDAKTPAWFELPKKPAIQQGDWVMSVSNLFQVADGKEELSVNLGVVSLRTPLEARHRTQDSPYEADALLVDAITSNPGAPGGALVDADGRLVGMIGKILESKNTNTRINYAIPADLLYPFVHQATGDVAISRPTPATTSTGQKAVIGIRPFSLSGKRSPAYIDSVLPGSPAARAGLKRDDLVMAIGGETVKDVREYERAVAQLRPGVEVTFLVKRKQDILELKVTPDAERPK
jgi:S1-C subfamily serine protease